MSGSQRPKASPLPRATALDRGGVVIVTRGPLEAAGRCLLERSHRCWAAGVTSQTRVGRPELCNL